MADSGWTIDMLKEHLQREIDDLRSLLDERYATQTKALDAAFVAAEKAVATALQSAKEAVNKAEAASADRFESVNEFRKQLADQATTFATRFEVDTRFAALTDKLDDHLKMAASQLTNVTSRLDLNQGQDAGGRSQQEEQLKAATAALQQRGVIIAVIAVITSIVIAIITIYLSTGR